MIYQNCIGSVSYEKSGLFVLSLGSEVYFLNINQLSTARRVLNSVNIEQMLFDTSDLSDFFTLSIGKLTGEIKLSIYELIQAVDLLNGTFYMLEIEDFLSRLDIVFSEKQELRGSLALA